MTAKIKLNAASGGGSFSLQAPSSSSNNRIFTLPDSADATLLTSTASLGKVLQVKVSQNTGNVSVVHNSSSSDSSQFGLQGYRTYGDLNTIQITPISATSTLIFQGHVACNSGSYSSAGSYGNIAVQFVGDVSGGVVRSSHDMTNAQWYPLATAFHTGGHLPSVFVVGHYALSNTDTVSWVHKGYSYEDGSGTNSVSFRNAHFMIIEVDI